MSEIEMYDSEVDDYGYLQNSVIAPVKSKSKTKRKAKKVVAKRSVTKANKNDFQVIRNKSKGKDRA